MSPQAIDLVQGKLEVLILKTVALEPMHGWGIGQHIQQVFKDVLQVGQGSLYPALHHLEASCSIRSEWGPSENNRRSCYHSFTRAGRKHLDSELKTWSCLSTEIALVLAQ